MALSPEELAEADRKAKEIADKTAADKAEKEAEDKRKAREKLFAGGDQTPAFLEEWAEFKKDTGWKPAAQRQQTATRHEVQSHPDDCPFGIFCILGH